MAQLNIPRARSIGGLFVRTATSARGPVTAASDSQPLHKPNTTSSQKQRKRKHENEHKQCTFAEESEHPPHDGGLALLVQRRRVQGVHAGEIVHVTTAKATSIWASSDKQLIRNHNKIEKNFTSQMYYGQCNDTNTQTNAPHDVFRKLPVEAALQLEQRKLLLQRLANVAVVRALCVGLLCVFENRYKPECFG